MLAAIVTLSASQQIAVADAVSEVKLKSAFVYNFTKFIEWPADRFASSGDPIVIGVLADEPIRLELTTIVTNRLVNGRPLAVRVVKSVTDMRGSHVLFVSSAQQSRYALMRDRRSELPAVLIVGDEDNCRLNEGAICFIQRDDKLRFEINMATLERSHLRVSSQLQKLAIAVNKGL